MNEILKYKILTFIRYIGDSFFWAFFSRFLVNEGYTNEFVGLLLSFTPLLSIFLNPIYASFTKDVNVTKIVLGIIGFVEAISIFLIGFNFGKVFILIFTITMAIFSCCQYTLMEAMVTIFAKTKGIKFTEIRIYGSIAYVIGTILGGFIAQKSYLICFSLSAFFIIVTCILYFTLKKIEYTKEEESEKISYKELLKNKYYVLFVIFFSLMYSLFYSCDNFYSTFLGTKGITDFQWGFVYAYFVSFEVITLILLNKFKPNLNRMLFMLISFGLFLVRCILFYFDMPLWITIGASALRGIMFATVLYCYSPFVVYLLGKKKGPYGIMFINLTYSIVYFGLSNLDGWLIDFGGYRLLYLVNGIAAVVIIILGIFLYLYYRKMKDKMVVEDESVEC